MQVSNYSEIVKGDTDYTKYLNIHVRQGLTETKRVLDQDWLFRNEPSILVSFDAESQITKILLPVFLANYSGFATTLYRLAYSEAHGFRGD